jgi:hypothetical protein
VLGGPTREPGGAAMEGAWRKVRRALSMRLCAQAHAAGDCDRRGTSGARGCRRGESGAASTPAGAFRWSKSVSWSASSSSKVR